METLNNKKINSKRVNTCSLKHVGNVACMSIHVGVGMYCFCTVLCCIVLYCVVVYAIVLAIVVIVIIVMASVIATVIEIECMSACRNLCMYACMCFTLYVLIHDVCMCFTLYVCVLLSMLGFSEAI